MAESNIIRQLKARLGATKHLLDDVRHDSVRHQAASSAQRCAVMELTRCAAFTSTSAIVKADLVARASEILWHEGDLEPVLAKLQPCEAKERRQRRGSQVFSCFPDFFDEEEWQTFLEPEVSMSVKKVVISKKLAALGLVSPC